MIDVFLNINIRFIYNFCNIYARPIILQEVFMEDGSRPKAGVFLSLLGRGGGLRIFKFVSRRLSFQLE